MKTASLHMEKTTSLLQKIIRKIKRFIKASTPVVDEPTCFYNLSPTCQVPRLAVIYERYFGRRIDGCFVEVGAYDGDYASNTSGLADIGWTGYYIEPVPAYYHRCKVRHASSKNITVSQIAIGADRKTVEINVGGPLSTIRDEVKQIFETLDWARDNFTGEKIYVQQLTLENYLIKHTIRNQYELLVIEVEGYEWEVLRNFDITKWMPQMIIIELHDQNDDYIQLREECNSIARYFDKNSYKVIYKDFSNTIYVPKELYPKM